MLLLWTSWVTKYDPGSIQHRAQFSMLLNRSSVLHKLCELIVNFTINGNASLNSWNEYGANFTHQWKLFTNGVVGLPLNEEAYHIWATACITIPSCAMQYHGSTKIIFCIYLLYYAYYKIILSIILCSYLYRNFYSL